MSHFEQSRQYRRACIIAAIEKVLESEQQYIPKDAADTEALAIEILTYRVNEGKYDDVSTDALAETLAEEVEEFNERDGWDIDCLAPYYRDRFKIYAHISQSGEMENEIEDWLEDIYGRGWRQLRRADCGRCGGIPKH